MGHEIPVRRPGVSRPSGLHASGRRARRSITPGGRAGQPEYSQAEFAVVKPAVSTTLLLVTAACSMLSIARAGTMMRFRTLIAGELAGLNCPVKRHG